VAGVGRDDAGVWCMVYERGEREPTGYEPFEREREREVDLFKVWDDFRVRGLGITFCLRMTDIIGKRNAAVLPDPARLGCFGFRVSGFNLGVRRLHQGSENLGVRRRLRLPRTRDVVHHTWKVDVRLPGKGNSGFGFTHELRARLHKR